VSGNPAVSNTVTMHVADVPVNFTVGNDTVVDGESFCANAFQNIFIAGNDQVFRAEPGSQVTLIAGYSIHLLPGTMVMHGAYLEGLIRAYGPFCEPLTDHVFSSGTDLFANDQSSQNHWKIFPNPTSGMINISSDLSAGETEINLYDYLGNRLMKLKNATFDRNFQFSLERFPAGIYYVLITDGNVLAGFRITLQK
jgi:hypothetical protein